MQKPLSDIPFFFIIGRPRSGTYLLRNLFDAHSNVIIPTECPMIVNLYPKYGHLKQWDKDKLNAFMDDVALHHDFQKWNINREAVKKKLLSYEGHYSFQTLIKAVYSEFQSVFPKKEVLLFGDKNPVYSTNTEKVLKAFPNAKYIHLTRDYRDNLVSIRKVDFEAPYTPLIAYRWRFSAKKVHRLKQRYPGSFFSMRYEDLVEAPEKNMRQLCKFLGIPYEPSVFEFYKKQQNAFANHPGHEVEKYHQSLSNPITTQKTGVWKTKLKEKDVKMADAVVGKYAEISGYSRKYYKDLGLLVLKGSAGFIYGRLSYLFADFLDYLPFRWRLKVKEAGSILAFVYNKVFGK